MQYGPIVIVGQARSGSTLLTRLLSDTRCLLIVNDAWFLQAIDDVGRQDALTADTARRLADSFLETLDRRRITSTVTTVDRSVRLPDGALDALREAFAGDLSSYRLGEDLLSAVMTSAARLCGAEGWGWNTPQDYLNTERIFRHFPDARLMFLIRDPYDVLCSYKALPRYWGEERRRYHPLLQSLVWRQAVREFRRCNRRHPDKVALIRYEDIVEGGDTLRERLLRIGCAVPALGSPRTLGTNSSRDAGPDRVRLTWIESTICRLVTGAERERAGYRSPPPGPAGLGGLEVLLTSGRCLAYYGRKVLRSRDMRLRVTRLGRSLLRVRE